MNYNVNGLTKKIQAVQNLISTLHPDFTVLTETHATKSNKNYIKKTFPRAILTTYKKPEE